MSNSENFESKDVIDYEQILDALKRKKIFITIITASSILLGALYTISRKPTWEGQFQIVIASQNESIKDNSLLLSSSGIPEFMGKSQLKTEVEILKSPSVLMPIFKEFVIYKKNKGLKKEAELNYLEWLADKFNIKLIRGSQVLNISYYDNDKFLITSVLEKVSRAYQSYSNKNRDREIELGLKYLENQVKIFKDRSINSLKEVQRYALQNSIPIDDFRRNDDFGRNDEFRKNSRMEFINTVKIYREYLLDIEKFKDSSKLDEYVKVAASNVNNNGLINIIKEIENLEISLDLARARFKPTDIKILAMEEDLKIYKLSLKENFKNFIKAEIDRYQNILSSTNIPEEVLLKFKELVRESERDDQLLSRLDAQFQSVSLKNAEKVDPWELITKPTLLDKPIAPRKLRIIAISTFLGLSTGIIYALLSYNLNNTIFNFSFIKQKYGWKLLQDFSNFDNEQVSLNCELFANSYLFASNEKSILFLKCGELDDNKYNIFRKYINISFLNNEIKHTDDIRNATEKELTILVCSIDKIKKTELDSINGQLNLLGIIIDGVIII